MYLRLIVSSQHSQESRNPTLFQYQAAFKPGESLTTNNRTLRTGLCILSLSNPIHDMHWPIIFNIWLWTRGRDENGVKCCECFSGGFDHEAPKDIMNPCVSLVGSSYSYSLVKKVWVSYFTYFMSSGRKELLVESCRSRIKWKQFTYRNHAEFRRPLLCLCKLFSSRRPKERERGRDLVEGEVRETYSFLNLMSCFSEHLRGCFLGVCDYYLAGCPSSRGGCVESGEEEGKQCE